MVQDWAIVDPAGVRGNINSNDASLTPGPLIMYARQGAKPFIDIIVSYIRNKFIS